MQTTRSAGRRLQAVSLLALLGALALLRVAPARLLALLPRCPFHHLTGLLCPGCGGTRALLALLHGDLRAAWHLNPLLLALAPLLLAYTVQALRQGRAPRVPAPATAVLVLLTLGFTIAHNL